MLTNSELKTGIKQGRLHLRLDVESKRRLEKAAAYARSSVSEFVLLHALQAAEDAIADHERIALNEADWNAFTKALEAPPAPNAVLRAALAGPLVANRS